MPHLSPIGDEDAGNVTLPGALSRFSRPRSGPGDALRTLTTPGGGQSTQRGRHCCPTRTEAWTSHALRDEVSLPSRTSDPSVTLRGRSLITPHGPGRLGHGHSLPGPWPRRPGAYGRQLAGRQPDQAPSPAPKPPVAAFPRRSLPAPGPSCRSCRRGGRRSGRSRGRGRADRERRRTSSHSSTYSPRPASQRAPATPRSASAKPGWAGCA